MMNARERLVELIYKYTENLSARDLHKADFDENMANYLLKNGVTVLPCKIGDTVYRISVKATSKIKYIQKTTISRIAFDSEGVWLFCSCNPIARSVFGKNVFLTKEEAEKAIQALKGGNENE